ncbi:MAG TPA: WD40 repeat domain-containing protein [Flavobacteriales bacterium]|nr:WD40 repeat domain-containing protein [Flavobacteriales bacterium]
MKTPTLLLILLLAFASKAQIPWDIEIIKGEAIGTEPNYGYGMDPVKTPNYHQLGRVTMQLENGKGYNLYKMLNYTTMQVSNLIVPMDKFPAAHMEALAMKQVHNGDILHYNGKVSTIKFDRRPQYYNTGEFICQYDHTTGQWSELVKIRDMHDMIYWYPMGVDRAENYYYYAIAHRFDNKTRIGEPTRYELARFDLNTRKVDTLFTLNAPKRGHYLHLDHTMLSPDGRWLVLSEYGDKAWRKDNPTDAQPVAYIIDTRTKKLHKTVRIPDTPYGHFITPDSKFMMLGSYETGEIVKIDLDLGTQVGKIKSTHTICNFYLAPSGNYFLIEYDEEKCPRKVYDARSCSDMKLITSVLLADLDTRGGMSHDITACMDGRLLYSHSRKQDSLKRPRDIYIHRLPENLKPAEPGSSAAKRLELAETLANGAIYAKRNNIDLNPRQYDMGKATSVSISSDNKVIVTGSRSLGDDFTAEEVIAKLTRSGEKIWETKLKTVKDAFSSEGMHIITPDGGCVVYFMYYDKPKSFGIGRLAKIDGNGKVIYDMQFTYQPLANATYMTKGMEVQNDGSVKVYGEIYPNAGDDKTKLPWVGTVSAEGKLVKSEY